MVPFRYQLFLEDLEYLVESGEVSMARIDDAVERILRVKFAAGLFEYPMTDRSLLDIVGSKVHLQISNLACLILYLLFCFNKYDQIIVAAAQRISS